MPINFIACVANYKNRLVIGKNNDLLVKLKEDLKFFKNITTGNLSGESKNIVLMGRKTYYSIPADFRPLKNRINFVLTDDKEIIKKNKNKKTKSFDDQQPYFMTFKHFKKLYTKNPGLNVFVIGGGQIYNLFLSQIGLLSPNNLYITELNGVKFNSDDKLTYMDNFDWKYKLIGYSEKLKQNEYSYRFLRYIKNTSKYPFTDEHKYLELANNILENGNSRDDRTEVGTMSLFGSQMRFDISNGTIPLLTTKRVPFKAIITELIWMMSGNTHNKFLKEHGVHIWDGNTSREFLDKRGLEHYEEGILGPGYGFQIRHQGAKYCQSFADTRNIDTNKIGGFDQLKYVEDLLENDPFSRRIMMSYWNPIDFDKTALLPCHYSIQFYVEEINGVKYLSGMFNMRSSDVFLGLPFNIVFYSTLVHILCMKHNFKPKELIYTGGDIHIYNNHVNQVKEQIQRIPRPFPKIKLYESLRTKDWKDMKISDFELVGYFPAETIKGKMAI